MQNNSEEYKALVAHALTIPLEERERIATEAVERMVAEREIADKEAEELIPKASEMAITNGMAPSIFIAIKLNGQYHVGINYQLIGTSVGTDFHYDHGVGIERNNDAMVLWIKSA